MHNMDFGTENAYFTPLPWHCGRVERPRASRLGFSSLDVSVDVKP